MRAVVRFRLVAVRDLVDVPPPRVHLAGDGGQKPGVGSSAAAVASRSLLVQDRDRAD
jgi:hypothetical protein